MNEIIRNLLTRRSVRSFNENPISGEDLKLILETAIYAPSGMNMQTWQFTAVTDRAKIQELAAAVGKALDREGYDFYKPDVLIIPSNERQSQWGMEDNACALENIFLAAHSLGIGSVWINQLRHVCDEPAIRSILRKWGIPDNHVIYGAAALGYGSKEPAGKVEKKGTIKIVE